LTEAELEHDEVQEDDHSNQERMLEDATDDVRNDERSIGELERQAAKLIAQTSELLNEYSQVGEEATDSKPQRRATHALTPNAADMWWDIDEA
jgi:phage shock protein A